MNLEVKGIHIDGIAETQPTPDGQTFNVPLRVEIGERGKEGAEVFHFVLLRLPALKLRFRMAGSNYCGVIFFYPRST